jgi:hypothetical protein
MAAGRNDLASSGSRCSERHRVALAKEQSNIMCRLDGGESTLTPDVLIAE